MEKKEKQLEEQDHPLKNTDHAFVQVGRNGEPVIPKTAGNERTEEKEVEKSTVVYDKP